MAAIGAAVFGASVGGSAAADAAAATRLRQVVVLSEAPSDWVRTDGRRVAFGRGARLTLADAGPPFTVRFDLSLGARVSDALLAGPRLILVLEGRVLGLLDVRSPEKGVKTVELGPPPRGDLRLAMSAGHLLVTERGVGTRVFRMEAVHGPGHHREANGRAPRLVQIDSGFVGPSVWPDQSTAGRLVYVAGGDDGLLLYRDETEAAQLFSVTVSNDFFSPQNLAIAVGDTVSWSNASGFHNVRSCMPEINGCETTSNEEFTSGPPAGPPWSYSYTFVLSGSNPYICQSHAPFMIGLVDVFAPTPPVVPAGMTVAKLDATGTELSLDWDATTCPGANDHQILYGSPADWPASPGGPYGVSGSQCGIGTASPFWWSAPGGADLLWWIVVATDGQTREGSWGRDSQLQERSGPGPGGASGECGILTKVLNNTCGE